MFYLKPFSAPFCLMCACPVFQTSSDRTNVFFKTQAEQGKENANKMCTLVLTFPQLSCSRYKFQIQQFIHSSIFTSTYYKQSLLKPTPIIQNGTKIFETEFMSSTFPLKTMPHSLNNISHWPLYLCCQSTIIVTFKQKNKCFTYII